MSNEIARLCDYAPVCADNLDVAIRKDHLGQHDVVGFGNRSFFLQLLHVSAGYSLRGRAQRFVLSFIEDARRRIVNQQSKSDERYRQHARVPKSQSCANRIKHRSVGQRAASSSRTKTLVTMSRTP